MVVAIPPCCCGRHACLRKSELHPLLPERAAGMDDGTCYHKDATEVAVEGKHLVQVEHGDDSTKNRLKDVDKGYRDW